MCTIVYSRWSAFRSQALERQNAINDRLMRLQKDEMTRIREWMTSTEDTISRLDNVGASISGVEKLLEAHANLHGEFERKKVRVGKL